MELGIMGPLVVADDEGRRIRVASARQRALLAALLVRANRMVPVDELAELVWDGAPPPGAARTVRSYVVRLRQTVGPRVAARIETLDPGYLCRVAERELDVLRFEALCRDAGEALRADRWTDASDAAAGALELWRDAPLQDVPSQALRDECAARLDQLRAQAIEHRAEAELNLGRHDRLVPELEQWISVYPLRERLHAQFLLALVRSGRQAEALAAYRRARETLVEQLGIEPGPELRALHRQILSGGADPAPVPSPAAATAAPAEAAGASAVPRQLPASPRTFVGRDAELDRLLALARDAGSAGPGTVVISAIDGLAGIGKTALALHAAHRVADRFPDGQLFVDLHGYTEGYAPRGADEALAMCLRSLGVPPQRVPPDVDERAALYRQRLAGTRTLIVLDNVLNEAQAGPLIPGSAGCLVLVTSRRRLRGLHDAHPLALDLLPLADAIALLSAVVGPERAPAGDPALAEIADLCGRVPLALRIAAALLLHRPVWSLEHVAGLLRDQRQRIALLADGIRDLGAVFDLSYQSLPDAQKTFFRLLGLIPGPDIDAYAAAALLDTDPAAAARLLESLVDHNLLLMHTAGRYRPHDLVRAHARALCYDNDPAEDRAAALDRLLDFYQHTALRADTLVSRFPRFELQLESAGPAPAHAPALADPDAAWTWLRTERPNLLAAAGNATDPGERTVALTAGLATLLASDGAWAQALALHTDAAEAARRIGDRAGRAHAVFHLGHVRALTGDFTAAVRELAQARHLGRAAQDRLGQAHALSRLGNVRIVTGDLSGAAKDLEEALSLYRDLEFRPGLTQVLLWLGDVRGLTGDLAGAIRDLHEAARLYRELGNRLGQAQALNRLGSVRKLTGDHPGATDDLQESLRLCREAGHRLGQANTLTVLGAVRSAAGDWAGATRDLREALALFEDLGERLGQANSLARLGRAWSAAGDHAGALRDLRRALDLIRGSGIRGSEAWALNHYAAVVAAAGDHAHALSLHGEALDVARETHQPDDQAVALEGLGECRLRGGDGETGADNLRQALELFRSLAMAADADRVHTRLTLLGQAG